MALAGAGWGSQSPSLLLSVGSAFTYTSNCACTLHLCVPLTVWAPTRLRAGQETSALCWQGATRWGANAEWAAMLRACRRRWGDQNVLDTTASQQGAAAAGSPLSVQRALGALGQCWQAATEA